MKKWGDAVRSKAVVLLLRFVYCLLFPPICGVFFCSCFCYAVLSVLISIFAIIVLRKRGLVSLL